MNRAIVIICMLIISMTVMANPIVQENSVISELWFADNGHLFIEFYLQLLTSLNINELVIQHGSNIAYIPYSCTLHNYGTPVVLDITELLPDMILNPIEDIIIIKYFYEGQWITMNLLRWGNGSTAQMSPLLQGQSIVNYYMNWQNRWCKDSPPTPGYSPCYPLARDTLTVIITDQSNNPLPNITIYTDAPEIGLVSIGVTDSLGIYKRTLISKEFYLAVKHPQTDAIIYQNNLWLEPNQTTLIPIQINMTANEDEIVSMVPDTGLKAFPTPFNYLTNEAVSFEYNGDSRLRGQSIIKLYDAKGRYVTSVSVSAKGTASWKPNRDIGSGIYFARLINSNRIIETTNFSVIK